EDSAGLVQSQSFRGGRSGQDWTYQTTYYQTDGTTSATEIIHTDGTRVRQLVQFDAGDPRLNDTLYLMSDGHVVREVIAFVDGSVSDETREYDDAGGLTHSLSTISKGEGTTSII